MTDIQIFDVAQFNQAAEAVWNESRRRALRHAEERVTHRMAYRQAATLLRVAEALLEGMLEDGPRERDLHVLRRALGGCPMVVSEVSTALGLLRSPTPDCGRARLAVRAGWEKADLEASASEREVLS